VLESKHVIGLFLLMLLFSGVFFTLGYVMGRSQYDGQVRAASGAMNKPEPAVPPRTDAGSRKTVQGPSATSESDPSTLPSNSDWEFTGTNRPANAEPRLESAPKAPVTPPAPKNVSAKGNFQPQPVPAPVRSSKGNASAPLIPSGAVVLQVVAVLRQDDAFAIASSLQKKHYTAYVLNAQKDKYYRVQVGPFKDQKSAEAAKMGLEGEGFKAFYVKH
jgi:cell division septation protein DedD